MTQKVSMSDNFSIGSFKQEYAQVTFAENPQMKIKSLKKQKHGYLIHMSSYKAIKGTIVNRELPSLH